MELKKYESPEMEMIVVEDTDVIVESTPMPGGDIDGGNNPWEF